MDQIEIKRVGLTLPCPLAGKSLASRLVWGCLGMAVMEKREQWLLLELILARLFGCLCQPASLGAPRGGSALPRVPLCGCSQSWRPFVRATWVSHLQAVSPSPSFPLCSSPSPFRCCCISPWTLVFLSRPPHLWVQLPKTPHPW